MARTKKTARKSKGGKASRKTVVFQTDAAQKQAAVTTTVAAHVVTKTTLPALNSLPRRALVTLANQHSIKGNLKTEELIRKLADIICKEGSKATGTDDDDDVCCICLTNESSVILLPCNHRCLCIDCANKQGNKLKKCPICRQDIIQATPPRPPKRMCFVRRKCL